MMYRRISDLYNLDFCLIRTDWKVPVSSYTLTYKFPRLIRTILSGLRLNRTIFAVHSLPFEGELGEEQIIGLYVS